MINNLALAPPMARDPPTRGGRWISFQCQSRASSWGWFVRMSFQFQRRSYGWSGMYYISKGALRVSFEFQQRCLWISFQLQRGCPSDFLQTESLRFPFHLRGVVHLEFLSHSQRLSIWQKTQRTPSLNLAGNPAGLPVEIVLRKTLLKSKGRSPLELKGNPDAPLEVERHPHGPLWNWKELQKVHREIWWQSKGHHPWNWQTFRGREEFSSI